MKWLYPVGGLVILGLALLLLPSSARAMPFSQFDKLSIEAQAEFVATMLDTVENDLRKEGLSDVAARVDRLFREIPAGDKIPLGIAELGTNIAVAAIADAKRRQDDRASAPLPVEAALIVTLKKQPEPIILSYNTGRDLLDRFLMFRPLTFGEFQAKPIGEQRRIVSLLVAIAFPDYHLREIIKDHTKTYLDLNMDEDLSNIIVKQFPASGEQPGFAEVVKRVDIESKKGPNQALFSEVLLYIDDQLKARLEARDKALDERAVMLPGGRLVFPRKDGVFVTVDSHGTQTVLENNLQPLAQALRRCMERRQLFAEQGLAACSAEVGIK